MKYPFESYLNVRSSNAPSFSPDGDRIAFISNLTGISLPWTIPADGGWPYALNFSDQRSSIVRYSPKGNLLAFNRDAGGNERWQIFVSDDKGESIRDYSQNTDNVHNFGQWSTDGKSFSFSSNTLERHRLDVYRQDIAASAPELVYSGTDSSEPIAWADNNKIIIVREGPRTDASHLFAVNLITGDQQSLTPDQPGSTYEPAGLSSNGVLYLRTDQASEFVGLAMLNLSNLELSHLESLDWDIEGAALSPDGLSLIYSINKDAMSHLILRNLTTNSEQTLGNHPPGVITGLCWNPNGRSFAFALNSPKTGGDIWSYSLDSGHLEKLTENPLNGIPHDSLVAPTVIRYQSFDGLAIPGLLYAPPHAKPDGKNTVVILIHGGPAAQARPTFDASVQYLVGQGNVVFQTNVRGSTGYGKTFQHLDDVRKRMDSVTDLFFASQWLKQSGWADPQKLVVMGGSYGGFMVLAALTTYPDEWAAGINLYGVSDFIMHLERTEPWGRRQREIEYGTIEDDGDFLREISPIHYIDRIKVPLMVIHGANDPRVSISVGESLVAVLDERNIPVEYVRFEDEGHGITRLNNRIKAYGAIAEFLGKHIV